MKHAAGMGNFHKLFHLIQATDSKALGMSETFYDDSSPNQDPLKSLVRWMEHFKAQIRLPSALVLPVAISAHGRNLF